MPNVLSGNLFNAFEICPKEKNKIMIILVINDLLCLCFTNELIKSQNRIAAKDDNIIGRKR